jgi:hypothetical protein
MSGSIAIPYEYYREKLDTNKHKRVLSPQEFNIYLPMHMNPGTAFEIACQYYDQKFVVTELRDKNGNLISFL